MAKELSQAELLDFLCQAGGRVANAALLGHFKGFLRDAAACPEELRRRRELFKGFVNSVATVKQEAPGGAKYVVLRKRFRELVGEEPQPPDGRPRQQPRPGQAEGAPRAHGDRRGERPRNRAEEEAEEAPRSRTCAASPRDLRAPPTELGGRPGPRLLPKPAPSGPPAPCALPAGERRSQQNGTGGPPGDPPALRGEAPQANGPAFPVGAPGAPPSPGLQRRIREWVARAHEVALQPDAASEESPWPARPSPPSTCASLSLDSQDDWRERLPVFRSIRCQLALQDLDEFVEQESPASEDGSSGSSSDSCRGEGEPRCPPALAPAGQNGCLRNPRGVARPGAEGPPCKLPANGLVGLPTETSAPPSQGSPVSGRLALHGQITLGSLDKAPRRPNGHLPKARKVARLPSPNLDAPLSPQLAHQQDSLSGTLSVEGLGPDTDGSLEHRSSLVPLEPREHAWLVKVATGSWLQARALFLEDPHLATRKDFISGYTVLHWLAKHGNAQVLLDFVTGAWKAGVALDVNIKSGCGYTPLHLAAMHGHQLVIRLLVQKLQGRTQVRDSSGKRPWQYLSSNTSGEIWQLLGAPRGKTIFPAHPIAKNSAPAQRGKSPELGRKISRKTSLAAYLKPQHIKRKMANKYLALQEREEYSD
ncbi:ankyrin repeat domain-containing protein SOWAHB [Heteronotia binoei]|uniref:ankyrin repeat domain-containing protein SOWAHB n=1 Tax=Heteronotia binoei TaxID=13085 RepID=UPI00292FC608|nr:ankyrin repeat domain-containing protein SOWAHB [Heteronotia binoei]